ncbi:MAG TPA: DUF1801 domain-containing protein [Puia sp.]|nr:DUF1801 domain-containing protein [Puia sp.]
MAKLKTVETSNSVTKFINSVKDETKRNDSFSIIKLITKQTGLEPRMWGSSIVGFGTYHYKYASGHEGDMPLVGFSPRSTAIVFYFCGNVEEKKELLQKLGKHKAGKGCVYVKKLQDINIEVLEKMVAGSIDYLKSRRSQ